MKHDSSNLFLKTRLNVCQPFVSIFSISKTIRRTLVGSKLEGFPF